MGEVLLSLQSLVSAQVSSPILDMLSRLCNDFTSFASLQGLLIVYEQLSELVRFPGARNCQKAEAAMTHFLEQYFTRFCFRGAASHQYPSIELIRLMVSLTGQPLVPLDLPSGTQIPEGSRVWLLRASSWSAARSILQHLMGLKDVPPLGAEIATRLQATLTAVTQASHFVDHPFAVLLLDYFESVTEEHSHLLQQHPAAAGSEGLPLINEWSQLGHLSAMVDGSVQLLQALALAKAALSEFAAYLLSSFVPHELGSADRRVPRQQPTDQQVASFVAMMSPVPHSPSSHDWVRRQHLFLLKELVRIGGIQQALAVATDRVVRARFPFFAQPPLYNELIAPSNSLPVVDPGVSLGSEYAMAQRLVAPLFSQLPLTEEKTAPSPSDRVPIGLALFQEALLRSVSVGGAAIVPQNIERFLNSATIKPLFRADPDRRLLSTLACNSAPAATLLALSPATSTNQIFALRAAVDLFLTCTSLPPNPFQTLLTQPQAFASGCLFSMPSDQLQEIATLLQLTPNAAWRCPNVSQATSTLPFLSSTLVSAFPC